MRIISILFLLFSTVTAFGQQDSLFVELKDGKWVIPYETKLGENLFILAKRYHVPPAILADENGLNYQDGIEQGTVIYIPFNKYNQSGAQPFDISMTRKVFYRVGAEDNLYTLSKYAGVPQHIMQQWNHLPDNAITEGQTLFAGWVKYDATQVPFPEGGGSIKISTTDARNDSVTVIKFKKPGADTLTEIEKEYMVQTSDGQNVTEEKGTVSFFNSAGKVKSSDTYYAFFNGAPRGTIIKVHNPGTDMTIYVKVLGPLPDTKQYYNAIMGIGSVAKTLLGVTDNKAWCELTYAAQ